MKKYIIIAADTNDGDYVTEKTLITDDEIELIKPMIEAVKAFQPYKSSMRTFNHNYPIGDCYRDDLGEKSAEELYGHIQGFEEFEELRPYGEYGIHSILSIEILVVVEEIKLL